MNEHDLKRALQREAPPAGFAARVLQRIESEPYVQPKRRVWWRAAAASVVLASVLGGYTVHVVEQRRGERAREQVLQAMSIAGSKIRYARQEVHEIGTQEK
ncbi:MAG TPA: hypothetical protein VF824_21180 [Thermoanaerobaculia bacterium]|jgi:hypothetical protein